MVKFYDENMNEVFLPKDRGLHYGSYPLELIMSSIEYEKRGSKRVPIGRTATLRAFIIASRGADMKLKVNRVYEFFRTLGEFYVADSDTPFELLKVSVDMPYTIGFGNGALIDYEIPLTVHKPYFKQSLHTTADLDAEGIRWNNKWAYGMGLSSDKREWRYSYGPTGFAEVVDLSRENYIYGFISGTGAVSQIGTGSYTLNEGFIDVVKGATYRFIDRGSHPRLNYWWLYMYNDDETFIERIALNTVGNGREHTFTAKGTKLKIMMNPIAPIGDNRIDVSSIGVDVLPQLNRYAMQHTVEFFNAGTEDIKLIQQKESEVRINIKSSSNWLEIYDGETAFRLNKAVKSGDVLRMRGHMITLNGNNVMGETNFNFLTVKKGWNEWEIRNLADFEFSVDFRFLYD